MNVKYFTVSGRGQFPIDMLRHDACWPNTSQDATVIQNTLADREFRLKGPWEVRLATYDKNTPTVGRWNSFMCKVEESK